MHLLPEDAFEIDRMRLNSRILPSQAAVLTLPIGVFPLVYKLYTASSITEPLSG